MNDISAECRREAIDNLKPQPRHMEILEALADSEMTAREIAYKLGYVELNKVRPRLTELSNFKTKRVEVVRKVTDKITGRPVSVFRRVESGRC